MATFRALLTARLLGAPTYRATMLTERGDILVDRVLADNREEAQEELEVAWPRLKFQVTKVEEVKTK